MFFCTGDLNSVDFPRPNIYRNLHFAETMQHLHFGAYCIIRVLCNENLYKIVLRPHGRDGEGRDLAISVGLNEPAFCHVAGCYVGSSYVRNGERLGRPSHV